MRKILMLVILLIACGGKDSVAPKSQYPASMLVVQDSTVDSVEVRVADSVLVIRANESKCQRFVFDAPDQVFNVAAWDAGIYVGNRNFTWSVDQYPNLSGRVWFDGVQYWAQFLPSEECAV